MIRYFYHENIQQFLNDSTDSILGVMAHNNSFELGIEQRDSWLSEIVLLKDILQSIGKQGDIIFEYTIPRLGKRIDVVLLIDGIVFALEFKVGNDSFLANDKEQVWDYALDLKNFHQESLKRIIVPILVVTEAPDSQCTNESTSYTIYSDQVYFPLFSNANTLKDLILNILENEPNQSAIDGKDWVNSKYSPTPTIIEAASALYMNHSVKDITKHEADKSDIESTTNYILEVIKTSKEKNQKSICFVTGVPGAGKTLVGLNVAIQQEKGDLAVYLSGNGPLVEVLTEALARDKVKKSSDTKERITKTEAKREVKRFIQIIHQYRDNMLSKIKTPIYDGKIEIDYDKVSHASKNNAAEVENVAIFDEAQRMWDQGHLSNWLARKKGIASFPLSEGEFLIWSLDQHPNWATIVCLVGGGQEINSGEGGIGLWIKALNESFPDWQVYISNELTDKEYAEGNVSELLAKNPNVHYSNNLHLSVSMRSYRAESLSLFVHQLLDLQVEEARETFAKIKDNYPIVLTRDLNKAKLWLKNKARGSERYGMLVSSKAFRLRPLAIDVRNSANIIPWFLNDITDIRSSLFLEDVATEFDIQGLELDWTCLVWDGDFRYNKEQNCWQHFNFVGDRWQNINNLNNQAYQLNAYRVLLTRARQGMVICIPEGNLEDKTRNPSFYDPTYHYFLSLGIPEL